MGVINGNGMCAESVLQCPQFPKEFLAYRCIVAPHSAYCYCIKCSKKVKVKLSL
jgi:hypothetical protein